MTNNETTPDERIRRLRGILGVEAITSKKTVNHKETKKLNRIL